MSLYHSIVQLALHQYLTRINQTKHPLVAGISQLCSSSADAMQPHCAITHVYIVQHASSLSLSREEACCTMQVQHREPCPARPKFLTSRFVSHLLCPDPQPLALLGAEHIVSCRKLLVVSIGRHPEVLVGKYTTLGNQAVRLGKKGTCGGGQAAATAVLSLEPWCMGPEVLRQASRSSTAFIQPSKLYMQDLIRNSEHNLLFSPANMDVVRTCTAPSRYVLSQNLPLLHHCSSCCHRRDGKQLLHITGLPQPPLSISAYPFPVPGPLLPAPIGISL